MPKTMTKADYEALGRNHARNFTDLISADSMFPRGGKSWQARAYWAAFDEKRAEIASAPSPAATAAAKEALRASMALDKAQELAGATIARIRVAPGQVRVDSRLGAVLTLHGPLYPKRIKGRSRRPAGWTGAA